QAAELRPSDLFAQRTAAFAEVFYFFSQEGLHLNIPNRKRGITLPANARDRLLRAMKRLEKLAQDPDTAVVVGSCESLALLHMVATGDWPKAANYLRLALKLDAARESTWELLVGCLYWQNLYEELLNACTDHLKVQDSARTRILLAHACVGL